MEARCPHCHTIIEVLGPSEMVKEYGLTLNKRMYAKDLGWLPEPWLDLGGAPKPDLYLRSDIEAYNRKRRILQGQEEAIQILRESLTELSPEDAIRAMAELDALEGAFGKKSKPKPKTRRPASRKKRSTRKKK